MGQVNNNTGTTANDKVLWLARVWRQADQAAIADRDSIPKRRAEYWARQLLRQAVDAATPRP